MHTMRAPEEINRPRRRLLCAAALTIAAAQFGRIGSASAQSGETEPAGAVAIKPPAMTMLIKTLAAVAAGTVLATSAFAQSAMEVRGPSQFVAIENEPAPKLIVDPPLPGPLARGAVLIPYRVENLRILPVLGAGALDVSPRVGHLHVTVDDLPWRWGDFSNNNTIVVVGLPPGQHKVLIELADPEHHIFTGQTVTFTVPDPAR